MKDRTTLRATTIHRLQKLSIQHCAGGCHQWQPPASSFFSYQQRTSHPTRRRKSQSSELWSPELRPAGVSLNRVATWRTAALEAMSVQVVTVSVSLILSLWSFAPRHPERDFVPLHAREGRRFVAVYEWHQQPRLWANLHNKRRLSRDRRKCLGFGFRNGWGHRNEPSS